MDAGDGFADLGVGGVVEHEDEFGLFAVALGLDHRADSYVRCAEDSGDLGEDAGFVVHGDAEVILAGDLVERLAVAVEAVGHEAAVAPLYVEGGGGFGEVGDDGAGGGVLACAASVEEGFADDVAVEAEGVEDSVDVFSGSRVFLAKQMSLARHRNHKFMLVSKFVRAAIGSTN